MKQNNIIIASAIVLIIAIASFMVYDLFFADIKPNKNIYEYRIDKLAIVDTSLICYSETQQIAANIPNLKGIATDHEDNIYVTGKNKILIYDQGGNLQKEIKIRPDALCISVDRKKSIFIGAKDHIDIWDTTGKIINSWKAKNDKAIITSIAINEPSVFVADAGNKIVYHYDMKGNLLNEIGRRDSLAGIQGFIIPSPYFDVAIGRDGELWAINTGRHQFEAYDYDGNLKSSWEKTSMTLEGFSGCCNPSHVAILPDGSFVTSEKGIERVKIHDPSGKFNCVVAAPDQFDKNTKGLDIAVDSKNRILILDPKKEMIRIFEKK